jgi:hypothetical protein
VQSCMNDGQRNKHKNMSTRLMQYSFGTNDEQSDAIPNSSAAILNKGKIPSINKRPPTESNPRSHAHETKTQPNLGSKFSCPASTPQDYLGFATRPGLPSSKEDPETAGQKISGRDGQESARAGVFSHQERGREG